MVTRRKDGTEVKSGDIVDDFRGAPWEFKRAVRAQTTAKSGKVLVSDGAWVQEFYDLVFDLTVTDS